MRIRSVLFASLLLTALAATAMAQNTLQNSTFEGTLAPWVGAPSAPPDPVASGTALWTDTRNLDNVLNGSGSSDTTLAAAAAQPANASFGIRQCVTLPSAPVTVTEANYEASFLAPATGNPVDGLANATIEVRFFSDAACATFVPGAGGSQGVDLGPSLLSDTQWYVIGDPIFVPPGGSIVASSAEVQAYIRTVSTTSNAYRAFFDHIVLSLNGTTPVELQHFGIE
jgi:hypothetical protein